MPSGAGLETTVSKGCTFHMRVLTLLIVFVVVAGLAKGCFRGRGSPTRLRRTSATLHNLADVDARARTALATLHAALATEDMDNQPSTADGTVTLRIRPGAALLPGSTSPARGLWAMACRSTEATAMSELLTVTANLRFHPTALHQFVGGLHRLGATADTPGAALRRLQNGATKFEGAISGLGGTQRMTEAQPHAPMPSAGRRSNGARRPSGRRRRAAAWTGILLASPRKAQDERPLAPRMLPELRG